MARRPSTNPTEVELQILGVLWSRGPSTVREVHDALGDARDTGYSTTLKMMQVMGEKGLLVKDDSRRPQVYQPAISQEQVQTRFVDDLIQRVFGGAADQLVMRAIKSHNLSKEELEHIGRLLKKIEGDTQ